MGISERGVTKRISPVIMALRPFELVGLGVLGCASGLLKREVGTAYYDVNVDASVTHQHTFRRAWRRFRLPSNHYSGLLVV